MERREGKMRREGKGRDEEERREGKMRRGGKGRDGNGSYSVDF